MRSPRSLIVPAVGSISLRIVLLADEAERLARSDVEADAIDGVDLAHGARQQALAHREMLLEAVDLEQRRRRSHGSGNRSDSKQAAKCSGAFASSGGASARQRATAQAQRGAKAQPVIGSRSEGTVPGISASRGGSARPRVAPSRGTEASSPSV